MKREVAEILLKNNCVQLNAKTPFTYASGLKGPIYCDNRLLLSYPQVRSRIIELFVEKIKSSHIEFDSVAGLATAGIPHGALIADRLNMPFIYIRSSAKGHGKGNAIEGVIKSGDKIILIEDLVNQAKSLSDAVNNCVKEDLDITGVFSIVDYQMSQAKLRVDELGLKLTSLTDFQAIVETAVELKLISNLDASKLERWQQNPADWK